MKSNGEGRDRDVTWFLLTVAWESLIVTRNRIMAFTVTAEIYDQIAIKSGIPAGEEDKPSKPQEIRQKNASWCPCETMRITMLTAGKVPMWCSWD